MTAPERPSGLTPGAILEMANAFRQSRPLLTAYELGLFTALADEVRSSAEVAEALETDPRATDRLMNALVALGLLEKRDGRFSNAPAAAAHLVKGRPGYMAGLQHTVHLWDTWACMTEVVRTGRSAARPEVNERGDDWLRAFIAAMHWRAKPQAQELVGLLDLGGVQRVLDVGGGSGAFSMAFVRAGAGIHAVVFDLPNVIPLAKNYIATEGFAAEISTVTGDYLRDALPGGFDLVLLSAIVHSNSAAQNRELVRKAADALKGGGRLVVSDWLMSEDRTAPLQGTLFALNMLVGTLSGDTYTEAEIRGWMEEAGLGEIARKETRFGTGLMIARKAGVGDQGSGTRVR